MTATAASGHSLIDARRTIALSHYRFNPRRNRDQFNWLPSAAAAARVPGTVGRFAHVLAFVLVLSGSGCAPTHPGGAFFAGYVFHDKQSSVRHDFVVKNTTSDPVEIRAVDKTCSCASFELGKYRLAPGESTTLTVKMDVLRSLITRSAACILRTDHPKFKDWSYSLTFVSTPLVAAEPSVLNLGSFRPDGQTLDTVKEVAIDVFAETEVGLARDNFTAPPDIELNVLSKASARKLQSDVWMTTYKLSIGLSAKGRQAALGSAGAGVVTKTIDLKVGEPKARRWQYSVYWQTLASLQCHPSHISFGNVLDPADDHLRRVAISSTTGNRFRILAVTGESRDIRIRSTFDAADDLPRHVVTLEVSQDNVVGPSSDDGARRFLSGKIQVRTTDKLRPVVEIPWSAMLDRPANQSTTAGRPTAKQGVSVE
jgi:Protein of unknown function (DUF1573)